MWTSCSSNQASETPSLVGVGADPGERRLRRLLHHVAELAGDGQVALPRVGGRLDEEHVAAGRGVGEPGRDPGLGGPPPHLAAENRRGPSHSRRRLSSTRVFCVFPFATCVAALRQTSASRRSRLRTPASRVYSRMIVRSTVSESDELRALQAGRGELLRQQVALGDRELLGLGVARELDRVHPVEERAGDRVERVRGADEQHLREVERQVEVVVAEASCSARGRAPRASRSTGRRGSPSPSCRSRRSGAPGCATRRRGASG